MIDPDEGEVLYKGEPWKGPSPERGIVFQILFPDAVAVGGGQCALAVDQVFPKLSKKERAEKARHYIDMVGLSHGHGP